MKASKLVHNNNWTSASRLAQDGIFVNSNKKKSYYFGLEEWINNPVLRKKKVGYIDSYRSFFRIGVADRIALFTFNPDNRRIFYVGDLYNVQQLNDKEIAPLRTEWLSHNKQMPLWMHH